MSHPNGAVSLAEVAMCVEDIGATCAKLGALFGMEAKTMPASPSLTCRTAMSMSSIRMVLPDGRRESSRLTCRMSRRRLLRGGRDEETADLATACPTMRINTRLSGPRPSIRAARWCRLFRPVPSAAIGLRLAGSAVSRRVASARRLSYRRAYPLQSALSVHCRSKCWIAPGSWIARTLQGLPGVRIDRLGRSAYQWCGPADSPKKTPRGGLPAFMMSKAEPIHSVGIPIASR